MLHASVSGSSTFPCARSLTRRIGRLSGLGPSPRRRWAAPWSGPDSASHRARHAMATKRSTTTTSETASARRAAWSKCFIRPSLRQRPPPLLRRANDFEPVATLARGIGKDRGVGPTHENLLALRRRFRHPHDEAGAFPAALPAYEISDLHRCPRLSGAWRSMHTLPTRFAFWTSCGDAEGGLVVFERRGRWCGTFSGMTARAVVPARVDGDGGPGERGRCDVEHEGHRHRGWREGRRREPDGRRVRLDHVDEEVVVLVGEDAGHPRRGEIDGEVEHEEERDDSPSRHGRVV